jgi:fatty acid desaturase
MKTRILSAAELEPLTRISNLRAAAAALQTWLIIAATLSVTLMFWSWPVVLMAIVIIGIQQHALFILSHEATHFRMFDNRRLNELIGRVCATAAGLSMCTYRVLHRLHHNHLYSPQDPDMALHGGYPRGKGYLAGKLLKDLSGLTAVKSYGYFFGNPAADPISGKVQSPLASATSALRAAACNDQRTVIAVHVVLPLLILAVGGWSALGTYLLLWVVPAFTVLQVILRLRAVCEHGAVEDVSSPLTAARTHGSHPDPLQVLARLTLFPHHVSYHVEHHCYPAVPHYRLPRLHRLLVRRGFLEPADNGSIRATLRKIFATRKVAVETNPAR